jgi:hypothetical protein
MDSLAGRSDKGFLFLSFLFFFLKKKVWRISCWRHLGIDWCARFGLSECVLGVAADRAVFSSIQRSSSTVMFLLLGSFF